jgi:hypothetical protein
MIRREFVGQLFPEEVGDQDVPLVDDVESVER